MHLRRSRDSWHVSLVSENTGKKCEIKMHWPSDTSYLIFKLAGMKVMVIIFNIVKGKKSDQQIMCGGGLSGHPSR